MHQIETLLPDHWQLFLSNFAAISVQARLPFHPRCGAAVKVGFHAPPLSKFHLYSSCQCQPLQLCKIDNIGDFFCIAHKSDYRHYLQARVLFSIENAIFFGYFGQFGEIEFRPEKSKWTFGYPGPQSVDIRSTFEVPMKSLGYSDSNDLCGRLEPRLHSKVNDFDLLDV